MADGEPGLNLFCWKFAHHRANQSFFTLDLDFDHFDDDAVLEDGKLLLFLSLIRNSSLQILLTAGQLLTSFSSVQYSIGVCTFTAITFTSTIFTTMGHCKKKNSFSKKDR
ncbi:hypothetical protein T03_4725 [Trichinella britovi]|uniref:Uncharacterized protein n=1 Tax=Trichinella britovi TaxID=45882 RepID=A0A0V1CF64_TRIBR|nr:hypothetical protein T03_4725 [Trichinella britovi]